MKEHQDLYHFSCNWHHVIEHKNSCQISQIVDDGDFFNVNSTKHLRPYSRWEIDQLHHSEEKYKENYGNPMCTIIHDRFTIVVGKTEDKTFIKLFTYFRKRERGQKFFRISTQVDYISFNHKTNSLYTGYITNYHKKRKFRKKVKKNGFSEEPINKVKSRINSHLSHHGKRDNQLMFEKNFIVEVVINTFIDNIPGINRNNLTEPDNILYKFHLDKWGVKLSDNWLSFNRSYPQPKKKDYVKSKMKYVDCIMNLHNLKGDKVRKALHQVLTFQGSECFHWACRFFGYDYIISKDVNLIKTLFESTHYSYYLGVADEILTKKEKDNCFMIFKLCLIGEVDTNTFNDHLNMIQRVRKFEDFKWVSNTWNTFSEEHYVLSEKLGFYTKGDYRRIYNQDFIEQSQLPIISNGVYYPILLMSSKEYNVESFVQSNCVKGYVNKAESLIISLRKGSEDSKERGTIEYKIFELNKKIMLRRVQTLGRFNQRLNEEWDEVIQLLDSNIERLIDNKIFKLPSVELKMGNRVVFSNSKFKPNPWVKTGENYLCWENDGIVNVQSLDNNPLETYLHGDIL